MLMPLTKPVMVFSETSALSPELSAPKSAELVAMNRPLVAGAPPLLPTLPPSRSLPLTVNAVGLPASLMPWAAVAAPNAPERVTLLSTIATAAWVLAAVRLTAMVAPPVVNRPTSWVMVLSAMVSGSSRAVLLISTQMAAPLKLLSVLLRISTSPMGLAASARLMKATPRPPPLKVEFSIRASWTLPSKSACVALPVKVLLLICSPVR